MTVITPESGFRARLRRLISGAAVFAISLGLCVVSGAPAATAATGDDDTAPAVELHLTVGLRGTVVQGGAATASIAVQNDSETALSEARVLLELNRTPLVDQASLTAWLDEESTDDGTFELLASESTSAVAPETSATAALSIPAADLDGLAPGVYPVRASLSGAVSGSGADATPIDAATTSVLVVDAASRPRVTVLVPLTATPADGASLLTRDELTALTAPDGDLTAQLDGVSGTSAVLAVDPSILAAIRVLGASAPAQVTDWLDRLNGLPNERFALQFADADATTQAQAGLPSLLQPTTLQTYLDPANFPATGATPTPTPTPEPADGPRLPDDETLAAVDGAAPGLLWPRGDATVDDLDAFDAYLGDGLTTILPSTALSAPSAGHVSVDGHDVLVADAAASDALSAAAAEADADARGRSLAAANAALFLSSQAAAGAPLLVGLDRDDDRTGEALREAVLAADSATDDLASLRASTPSAATLAGGGADLRGDALQLLLAGEDDLSAFATILEDPRVLLAPERIRILRVISAGSSTKRFASDVEAHRDQTAETLDAVNLPQSSTIQLLTAAADLPFSVRNDLPWPVTIRLTARPSDPRLEVERVTEQVIQANTNGRVKVRVSSRVGSGELDLGLSLSSPTGVQIGQPQSVRVAVRAEWEGIGLGVFGGLIVVLLSLGIYRTVRRRRHDAAAGGDPDAADVDADADTDASADGDGDGTAAARDADTDAEAPMDAGMKKPPAGTADERGAQ
ncbi:DUF6049 family protein [Streptomyces sp. AC495_CC817]|uniref:DUF6049 family protein n=1 Tax=Streptomyces sp. AC495_CC817 TaxID=2823900 RepID=UPI001C25B1AF|nr:DUF6049 family protein [Streptomyces sp. AC495_CC817]